MKFPRLKSLLTERGIHDKTVTVIFVLVAVALVCIGVWTWRQWRASTPDVDFSRYPVRGIDVSAHNGDIDFRQVRSDGFSFVFVKASEGESFRDKKFADNFDRATAAGLKVGAYHFFRFDNDGVMQAMNLCQALDGRVPPIGVAIDIEDENNAGTYDPATVVSNLEAMLDYLKIKGLPVTLYSNKDGYHDFIKRRFDDYPLWICSFSDPPIDADWTYWQHSHSGSVKGIDGKVDLNVRSGKWD